ncbi:hypothetical protein T484DRAFT_1814930 [Baffinella frigidus]|nr:hypothetical protein T484DRAFT_1814930 [Cryptophyta sp. CCMP2293]
MEDVRWFSRQAVKEAMAADQLSIPGRAAVKEALASEQLSIPGRAAVAYHLITSWLDA